MLPPIHEHFHYIAVYEDCNDTDVEVCTNGGVCRKLGSSYICECPDGYTGLSCQSGTYY